MMPFSNELKQWCNEHPDFFAALKVIYPHRFIALQTIATSYSPLVPEDEVIGIYAYDYQSKPERYKQDFIVNKSKQNKEFILFTRLPSRKYGKYVKDINEFFATYSKGKYYTETHHVAFEDLPDEIKPRAIKARELGKKLKVTGLRTLTQNELEEFDQKLQDLKL